jgi:hypothetical protein
VISFGWAFAAEPSVTPVEVHEARCKTSACDTVRLRLDNPSDRPVWFVVASHDRLGEDGRYLTWSPGQVDEERRGETWVFRLAGFDLVRLRPSERAVLTEDWYGDPVGVGIADVTVDGRSFERYLLGHAWDCASRGDTGPSCRDELIAAWDDRISHVAFDWRARWEVAPGETPAVRAWQARPERSTSVPVIDGWNEVSPDDRAALEKLPRERVAAWLDEHWLPVFASATMRVWQKGRAWGVLDGERLVVRMIGKVSPLDPEGLTVADEGEAWWWKYSWTRDATAGWAPGGAGYVTLHAAGLTRIGRPEEQPGLNGPLYGPTTLSSSTHREKVAVLAGMVPEELVDVLVAGGVESCYDDARFGNARSERSAQGLVLEPGTDLGFGGHVSIVADVAADGHVTAARVEGPTTPRFSACIAREVPKAWWLARSTDGQPYRVAAGWELLPAF